MTESKKAYADHGPMTSDVKSRLVGPDTNWQIEQQFLEADPATCFLLSRFVLVVVVSRVAWDTGGMPMSGQAKIQSKEYEVFED